MLKERGVPYIDLSRYWGDYDEKELTIARWDRHPNAKAHQLIAEKLLAGLRRLQKGLVGDASESIGN
jgi:lysophospholipase L1-like esterase